MVFEINEDMVQLLLMLEIVFTQDSEVEELFRGASSSSEPDLLFRNYLFGLAFKPIQDNFIPPTSEKLRGHIGLGLFVRPSVCLSVTLGS